MKGQFFIQWGTKRGQHTIKNVELNVTLCPMCKKPTKVNFNYISEATEVYWISGSGRIKSVSMLCLNCGEEYELVGTPLIEALKLFKEASKGHKSPDVDILIRETEAKIAKEIKDEEKKKKRKEKMKAATTKWQKIKAGSLFEKKELLKPIAVMITFKNTINYPTEEERKGGFSDPLSSFYRKYYDNVVVKSIKNKTGKFAQIIIFCFKSRAKIRESKIDEFRENFSIVSTGFINRFLKEKNIKAKIEYAEITLQDMMELLENLSNKPIQDESETELDEKIEGIKD